MERLIKQKEQIERDLKINKERLNSIINEEVEVKDRIKNLKSNRESLTEKYNSIKEKLKQKKVLFIKLKLKIKEFKEYKYKDIKEIYINKYKRIIENVNKIEWKFNLQIFNAFNNLNQIKKEAEIFKNLVNEIENLFLRQKKFLKSFILKEVIEHKEIHNMIYLLKFIKQYEEFFKEELFVDCINEYISKRYEYHFLSDKETNRLDKAEWIFNFLEKKIKEVYKFMEIYNTLKDDKQKNNDKKMDFIMKNIIKLVNLRINELEELESKQKRNILLNFNLYLSIFIRNIKKDYSINLEKEFEDFRENLIIEEKKIFHTKLQNIHKLHYKEWFSKYEEIIKENLDLNKKYLNINVEYIIDNILEYNLVFIDSMRYINRKEIKVLIYLFNMFENLKETVHFLFEENIQDNSIMNNEDLLINEELDDDLLMKISKFNLENFKLIKTLFENDINNVLNLKFYFINDLQVIMDDYKKCKGFLKLKKMASEMIDNYLMDILLKRRLDKHEYVEFLDLFKKLKDLFDVKTWKSRECMKCIKGIYENKDVENRYTKEINDIYFN